LAPEHAAQAQLDTVVNEAERLERLVTDLLDFARPREPQISNVNLTDLVEDVANVLKPRLEASGVTLQLSSDPTPLKIQSDPGGLRQVLLNVILNAIDASPAGNAVALQIFTDGETRAVVIQADDRGKGVGTNNPEELFQPFVTTKTRGTGLGLAISRQIVENLGGSLTLGDNPQGGARCSIRLPLRDAED
jgi:two-component system sensor histidine kinase HydH